MHKGRQNRKQEKVAESRRLFMKKAVLGGAGVAVAAGVAEESGESGRLRGASSRAKFSSC